MPSCTINGPPDKQLYPTPLFRAVTGGSRTYLTPKEKEKDHAQSNH